MSNFNNSSNLAARGNTERGSSDAPSGKRSTGWFVPVLLLLVIVGWPLASYGLKPEITRWKIASATETLCEEGYEVAITKISGMIESDPDNRLLLAQRSQWLSENGQLEEALADSEVIVKQGQTGDSLDHISEGDLIRHIDLLTRLNKISAAERFLHELETREAEVDLKEISFKLPEALLNPKERNPILDSRRNTIAYFYSRIGGKRENPDDLVKMIDYACRDYVPEEGNTEIIAQLYALGSQHEKAVTTYSEIIDPVLAKYQTERARLAEVGTDAMAYGVPVRGEKRVKVKSELLKVHSAGAHLRQLLEGRANSYESLGQTELAEQDRDAIKKLGEFATQRKTSLESLVPQSKSVRLNPVAMQRLSYSAMFIDTRGCVRLRQGKYEQALADFNYSLQAMEAMEISGQLGAKSYELRDPREAPIEQRRQDEQLATMLYHRAVTYRKLAKTAEAEKDEQQIRDLGFEVNKTLF